MLSKYLMIPFAVYLEPQGSPYIGLRPETLHYKGGLYIIWCVTPVHVFENDISYRHLSEALMQNASS